MKVMGFLSRMVSNIASVIVGIIMMLTVTDVFMRYVFVRPITGSTEMIEFFMVILILGVLPTAMANRHIRIDLFRDKPFLMPLPCFWDHGLWSS